MKKHTAALIAASLITIVIGLASRLVPIGMLWYDKYVGDALYAVLFYLLLSLLWQRSAPHIRAAITLAAMIVIETFQLTGIALALFEMGGLPRLIARVLGTTFSWWDILAYVVGIAGVWLLDLLWFEKLA